MKHIKDAYYFPHDSNAKDDPKCVLLIEQLGLEGYGTFWVLVETLREQPDFRYPLKLIPALARRYNTTAEKMKAVVLSFGLFTIENDSFFFSESLDKRMKIYLDRKQLLSEAGKKGNSIRWGRSENIATRSGSDQVAIANKTKENKTNKSLFSEETDFQDLKIPDDGVNRNYEGFVNRLKEYNISPDIALKAVIASNYGAIGSSVWKILNDIRDRKNSKNKINDPSAYLAVCLSSIS